MLLRCAVFARWQRSLAGDRPLACDSNAPAHLNDNDHLAVGALTCADGDKSGSAGRDVSAHLERVAFDTLDCESI